MWYVNYTSVKYSKTKNPKSKKRRKRKNRLHKLNWVTRLMIRKPALNKGKSTFPGSKLS